MNADRKAQLDSAIEVAKVLKTIDSLPDRTDITVEDMDQIKAAEDAFDSLTKAQKDNLMPDVEAKLENAENAVIDLVSQAIAKVASAPVTIESEKDITEARKLYDALSDKLKNNPTAQTVVKLLEGKEAELENLKKSQSVPTVTPAPATAPTAAVTPTPAAATKEPVVGDIVSDGTSEYEVTSVNSIDGVVTEGTAVYKKNLDSKLTTIEIPDVVTVDDVSYNVTGVANDALKGNKKIKKLIIGENVETIGKRAFSGCIKLASVNMKSPVLKTIDDNAFFNCKSLKSYTVSTGVTTIGARAFMNCKKLTKITFKGKNVKKINANAFKNVPKTCKAKAPKKAVKSYKKLMKKAAYKGSVSK